MRTVGRGVQRGMGALVLMIAMHTQSAALDRLRTLGGISLRPLTDQACAEAPKSTDSLRLEKLRGNFLQYIEHMDVDLAKARQAMAQAEGISNTFARSFAQSVDQVAKLNAALKVDALEEADNKKLAEVLEASKVRLRSEQADVIQASENMEKAAATLVEADSRVTLARPEYLKAVDCVEKRLAALRQAPPPIASASGARGPCKLEGMDWQTPTQLRVRLTVSKGGTCEQKITGSGNVIAQNLRLFIQPKNGAAEVRGATTVVYRPNPGHAGDDTIGLFMQTNSGARTVLILVKVQ